MSITQGGSAGGKVSMTISAPRRRGLDSNGITRGLGGTGAYVAGGYGSQELSGWHPRQASADAEILPNRDKIVARARDLDRNNGWARGGVDKRVDAVVGANIWLRAKPDFRAMGQTAEWADEWSVKVESLFRVWANSSRFLCDVERHHHFGGLVRLAYTHYVLDGEACAPIYDINRGGLFGTSILILDPDRLANPEGKPDDKTLRGGVALDRYGAARGYWVRKAHQDDFRSDWDASNFEFVPRETPRGRPLFVHVFDKRRAHARRGLGRFTSVMARFKMLDSYDRNELQKELTRSIFGVYAKTTRDSDGMLESLSPVGDEYDDSAALDNARAGFYEQSDITLNGVRIAVLPDGDEMKTIESSQNGSNFQAFQRAVLNSIAGPLGISGEQLSNDWQGINYSSARTLLNEIWRGLNADRHIFTQSFCTPIYAAWLEEACARKDEEGKPLVEIPGGQQNFYRWRDALTQADWIGPGRGTIDPKKESEAGQMNRDGFVSTLEMDCAEQGVDWRNVLWQRKREDVELEKYGLVRAPPKGASAQANQQDQGADERAEAGADE